MISSHYCLDHEYRLGQETDCVKCRALLLEAFRAPVTIPVQRAEPEAREFPSATAPTCSCSFCQSAVCAYCGQLKGNPGCFFCWEWD